MLFCPWDFPGRNTEGGCHALSKGSSWPRNRTHISYVSCNGGWAFTTSTTWEAPSIVVFIKLLLLKYRRENELIISLISFLFLLFKNDKNSQDLLGIYTISGTILSNLHVLAHLIFTTLWKGHYYS